MIRIFGLVLASFFAFEAFEKILTIKYFSFILNFAENTVPRTLTITYSILDLHEISSKCGIQMSILAEMDSSQINGHWSVLKLVSKKLIHFGVIWTFIPADWGS